MTRESPLQNYAEPFAFSIGQRVRFLTGEKGSVYKRWLTASGPKYLISLDGPGVVCQAFESEIAPLVLRGFWESDADKA